MDHEGTAAQPAGDPGVAGTRTGAAAADAAAHVDPDPAGAQRPDERVRDGGVDIEAQVDDLLADVAALPLREQVDVFESVHAVLTDRLSEKDA